MLTRLRQSTSARHMPGTDCDQAPDAGVDAWCRLQPEVDLGSAGGAGQHEQAVT